MKNPWRAFLYSFATSVLAIVLAAEVCQADDPSPRVLDPQLVIELFTQSPEIVTPTGIAVDRQGRVLVIESHTHFRPDDYQGPQRDRILLFVDADGDGRADRKTIFYEGYTHGMDLAIHRDGSIYVATRSRIDRLLDHDGDGECDEAQNIARLETTGTYPHNGLSGLAFDFAGDLYFGLGENLGHDYELIGSDGTTLSGGGEGGIVCHIDADGTNLERIATGFWNPFGGTVDVFGRLFYTDNDPGSSPPCRLHHVVPGGDYGYEYRYGRTGLHPLITWYGELPGTLAMIAGTGEAPCEVIAYESDGLPAEYRGELLVASWGDHRIERYTLIEQGASFSTKRTIVVQGDTNFRPVGIAVAPDGSLYISDWVNRNYKLHGKGRIWHLRSRSSSPRRSNDPHEALLGADRHLRENAAHQLAAASGGGEYLRRQLLENQDARVRAAALFGLLEAKDKNIPLKKVVREDPAIPLRVIAAKGLLSRAAKPATLMSSQNPPAVHAVALRAMDNTENLPILVEYLSSDGPFLRNAAIQGLTHLAPTLLEFEWQALSDVDQRVGILLALKKSGLEQAQDLLPDFLADPAETVRFSAVKWVADKKLFRFHQAMLEGLDSSDLTPRMFIGFLAALDRLENAKIKDRPEPNFLLAKIFDSNASLPLRRLALRYMPPDHPALSEKKLRQLLEIRDRDFQMEVVRTMATAPLGERSKLLARIAKNRSYEAVIRAAAIVGLTQAASEYLDLLILLTSDDDPVIREEALRALLGIPIDEERKERLLGLLQQSGGTVESVGRLLGTFSIKKPQLEDTDTWLKLIEGQGDPEVGQRIFFHSKIGLCSRCHTVDGRGIRVGPDLSTIGRRDHRWLLESILAPSKEIAPQYVSWMLMTKDGRTHIGFALRKGGSSGQEVFLDTKGKEFKVRTEEIVARREQETSIMPTELAQQMTFSELRDLIAYLQQLR